MGLCLSQGRTPGYNGAITDNNLGAAVQSKLTFIKMQVKRKITDLNSRMNGPLKANIISNSSLTVEKWIRGMFCGVPGLMLNKHCWQNGE